MGGRERLSIEAIALIGGERAQLTDTRSDLDSTYHTQRSHLLWSLKRLGVSHLIIPPSLLEEFTQAQRDLAPPPPDPHYEFDVLLGYLRERERNRARLDLLGEVGWPLRLQITPPPTAPLKLGESYGEHTYAGVNLCFHDELIGEPDTLLIHYGEARAEMSGYHSNISSISVPSRGPVSAILLLSFQLQDLRKITRRGEAQTSEADAIPEHCTGDYVTGVIHIDAHGGVIKGPWWPNLGAASKRSQ